MGVADEAKGKSKPWCYTVEQPPVMNRRRLLCLLFSMFAFATSSRSATTNYVPMKVIQTDDVVFPRRALEMGVTSGLVRVSVQVDEHGKLTDQLVTGYTHPALADAAVQALKRWRFEPAWMRGERRSATVDLNFEFENRGLVVVDLNAHSYAILRDVQARPGAYSYGARTLRQLDAIPTPKKVVQPAVPGAAAQKQEPVVITVFFYIDEQGRVRMPAVGREVSAEDDAFAAAAVDAVSQWEFEPPMSRGEPVLVAARQDIKFHPAR